MTQTRLKYYVDIKNIVHPSNIYVVHSIDFQIFLVHDFKIDVDSLKFSMLLLYIL